MVKASRVPCIQTNFTTGWGILVFVVFASIFGQPYTIIVVSSQASSDPLWIKVVAIIVLYVGEFLSLWMAIEQLRNIFFLQIDGTILYGKTMLGFRRQIDLKDVQRFHIARFMNTCVLQMHTGKHFYISPFIDFHGYIYDYILLHLEPNAKVDMKGVQRLRNNTKFWLYSPRSPVANYSQEDLKYLNSIAQQQKKELMRQGVLSVDRTY